MVKLECVGKLECLANVGLMLERSGSVDFR